MLKKNRRNERLFVAEGPKVVEELMASYRPRAVFATSQWKGKDSLPTGMEAETVSADELCRLSFQQHPQQVVAVFEMGETGKPQVPQGQLTLMLDGVQDPGNFGTIIRIADWYGINNIICSIDTADAYNPKVVQATMGSLARVRVTYAPLLPVLKSLPEDMPIYGTLLDGADIYASELSSQGVIIMGNEGNGISEEVRAWVKRPLLIPSFRRGDHAESLNVAIATAITCSEFCRRLGR